MSWMRFLVAVVVAGVVSSLTDWLFMGDLLYRKFNSYPEIWRHRGGHGESAAIAWSSPLPFVSCAVFCWLCLALHLHGAEEIFKLAIGIWLAAPLPLLVTHGLFIKLEAPIVGSYCAGWLVKLLVAAGAAVWMVR
jgi:hypothetical protein